MTRDTLTKAVYGALFTWTIAKINRSLDTPRKAATLIGVLDIFGFESFENNSFEQLCINYCNEKLQFHFNEHIFKLEQDEYAKEGIVVPRRVRGQRADARAARGAPHGHLRDDRRGDQGAARLGRRLPLRSSSRRTTRSTRASSSRRRRTTARTSSSPRSACIHYAGDVFYNVEHFLEKNKDELHADVVAGLASSSSEFVHTRCSRMIGHGAGRRRRRGRAAARGDGTRGRGHVAGGGHKKTKTLGAQFKQQLAELMTTLNATEPHFVRCMKSNHKKVGDLFQADMMLAQLRYSGLLEVCRIRKLGYPIRFAFAPFLARYAVVAPDAKDVDGLLAKLAALGALEPGEFAWARPRSSARGLRARIGCAARPRSCT